jgi:hypothetical protein
VSLKEELLDVKDNYGTLTPENVVKAASPPTHPLHSRFEWDDSIAGHQYRLSQARTLIRTVHQPYVVNDEIKKVRTFHSLPQSQGKQAYQPLDEIVQDPVATGILIAEAQRAWRQLYNRYKHLQEFVDLVRADMAAEIDESASA